MKSSVEKEEKSKLCKSFEVSECGQLHQKFAVKHINSLICGSYFTTIVIALALTAYIHYVGEQQSQKIQISLEKFVENELLKLEEYNNKKNERLHGWVCLSAYFMCGLFPKQKFLRQKFSA